MVEENEEYFFPEGEGRHHSDSASSSSSSSSQAPIMFSKDDLNFLFTESKRRSVGYNEHWSFDGEDMNNENGGGSIRTPYKSSDSLFLRSHQNEKSGDDDQQQHQQHLQFHPFSTPTSPFSPNSSKPQSSFKPSSRKYSKGRVRPTSVPPPIDMIGFEEEFSHYNNNYHTKSTDEIHPPPKLITSSLSYHTFMRNHVNQPYYSPLANSGTSSNNSFSTTSSLTISSLLFNEIFSSSPHAKVFNSSLFSIFLDWRN